MGRRETTLVTAQAAEPILLADARKFLEIDSTDVVSAITPSISIAVDEYSAGAVTGDSVDVSAGPQLASLTSGTYVATSTNDVKLQDSPDDSEWNDVVGGAFTQVTTANDQANQTLSYTNGQDFLRAIATVANANATFGVNFLQNAPAIQEDDLITALIVAARRKAEKITGRALITQTWKVFLQNWPASDRIKIPFPPLVSITHLKWKDEDGTQTTVSASTYIADTDSNIGQLVLVNGQSWPSASLYPVNAIEIQFVAGYGTAGSDVPEPIVQGMKLDIANQFKNRGGRAIPFDESILGAAYNPYRVNWY